MDPETLESVLHGLSGECIILEHRIHFVHCIPSALLVQQCSLYVSLVNARPGVGIAGQKSSIEQHQSHTLVYIAEHWACDSKRGFEVSACVVQSLLGQTYPSG